MGNRYWFKPKSYGLGFVPVTWEGWLATITLVAILLLAAWLDGLMTEPVPPRAGFRFLLDVLLITGISVLFFERKTKEPTKWRCGKDW